MGRIVFMSGESIILVAEDEESDAWLLEHAFARAGLHHRLVVLHDGQEAVAYLGGAGPYTDRKLHPLPSLMLLDLKMPRMNGFDVLAWMRKHPDLQALPVVVLSSSSLESDVAQARQMGARDYVVKPHEFSRLVELVRDINQRWLAGAVA